MNKLKIIFCFSIFLTSFSSNAFAMLTINCDGPAEKVSLFMQEVSDDEVVEFSIDGRLIEKAKITITRSSEALESIKVTVGKGRAASKYTFSKLKKCRNSEGKTENVLSVSRSIGNLGGFSCECLED